jgi:choline dehydrogenase-like flavoprotein
VRPTDLQVYNNPGLYVIDGSVFPVGVFRNPANTIGAIAEKAMDVILQAPGAPTW